MASGLILLLKLYSIAISIYICSYIIWRASHKTFWKKNEKYSIYYYAANDNLDFFLEKKKDSRPADFFDLCFTIFQARKLPPVELAVKTIFFLVLYILSFLYLLFYSTVFLLKIVLSTLSFLNFVYFKSKPGSFTFLKKKPVFFKINERRLYKAAIFQINISTNKTVYTVLGQFFVKKQLNLVNKLNVLLLNASFNKLAGKPAWILENIRVAIKHFFHFFFQNSIWSQKVLAIYPSLIKRELVDYINSYTIQLCMNISTPAELLVHGHNMHQKLGAFINSHHNLIINTQAVASIHKNINHQAFLISPKDSYSIVFTLTSKPTYTDVVSHELDQNLALSKNEKEVRLTSFSIGEKLSGGKQFAAVTVTHQPLIKHKSCLLGSVLSNNLTSYKNGTLDIDELTSFIMKTELASLLSTTTDLLLKDLLAGRSILIKSETPLHTMQFLDKIGITSNTYSATYSILDTIQIKNELKQTILALKNEELIRFLFDANTHTFNELKENIAILLNENNTITLL